MAGEEAEGLVEMLCTVGIGFVRFHVDEAGVLVREGTAGRG